MIHTFFALLVYALACAMVRSNTYDMIAKTNVTYNFVSIGFIYVSDTSWTNVRTLNNQFTGPVIVLLGVPEIDGPTSNDGFPASVKMQNVATLNGDGTYSFSARIVQPNDSFCAKTWATPKYITTPIQVSWAVMQQGAWKMTGKMLIVGSGSASRASNAPSATVANGNLNSLVYPVGCVSSTQSCDMTNVNRGGIAQIQTSNNVKEVGKQMFLSVRAKTIGATQSGWVLIPHDSSNANYYVLSAETLGYVIFETGVTITCLEGFVIETSTFFATSVAVTKNFAFTYRYVPGLFGIVGTVTSLADSTTLRTFARTTTSAKVITQEDKCVDQETNHTTQETIYIMVVGEVLSSPATQICNVVFNSAIAPTLSPTRSPTFTPSSSPTTTPTCAPSSTPTRPPTFAPTIAPTFAPSFSPTRAPTFSPTCAPTFTPTFGPTFTPTFAPTVNPTRNPTVSPTFTPSSAPTDSPTFTPTFAPTVNPTRSPTVSPTFTPSSAPTDSPTFTPTFAPTVSPTRNPTVSPTFTPSSAPTDSPTFTPTFAPTVSPTRNPTDSPTFSPTSAPTVSPTRNPTESPTFFPTIAPTTGPTFTPTYAPSSPPTFTPSFAPSVAPTYAPTKGPTISPTSLPTSTPTVNPTSMPTVMNTTCVTALLWDRFGDGWDNLMFEFIGVAANTTANYTLDCACKQVVICMPSPGLVDVNLTISIINPALPVRHSWEAFFAVFGPGGKIWVGKLGSILQIVNNKVVGTFNMVNTDPNAEVNECKACSHPPKPPPKKPVSAPTPAPRTDTHRKLDSPRPDPNAGPVDTPSAPGNDEAKPRRPPLNLPFVLTDWSSPSIGWYPTDPYSSIDICLNQVPAVVVYPRYFISNGDRTSLIQSGTMCGDHSKEPCQEVLPYDGHFVWRVAGYGNENAGWTFCGVSGTVGQELQFEMRNGRCVAHQLLSAEDYCAGIVSLATLEGTLFLTIGDTKTLEAASTTTQSGPLSPQEFKILENTIANIFNDAKVSVKFVTMDAAAGGIDVLFAVVESMEPHGYVGTNFDKVEAFEAFILSELDASVSPGYFVLSLQSAVSMLATDSQATSHSTLSSVQSASILSLTVVSVEYEVNMPETAIRPHSSSSSEKSLVQELSHMSVAGITAIVLLCGVVIVALAVVLSPRRYTDVMPSDSEAHLIASSQRGYGARTTDVDGTTPYEARSDSSFFRGRPR